MNRQILLRQARELAIAALVGGVLGGAYGLLSPKWYEAQISVVPEQQKGLSGLASLASSLPVDLPVDIGGGGGGADTERIQAVLKSRSVSDAVIEKFGLMARYDVPKIETARKHLWTHCGTKLDKKPAIVTVTCEDRDPKTAAAMAEYFGEVGNSVLNRISASSAKEERRFLERRVVEARRDVEAASLTLKDFELKHRLVDIGEQSKAVVSAMATLKGELMSKQIELSYLNSFSSADESTAKQLRRQVAIMEAKLKSLEEETTVGDGKPVKSSDPGLFPAAMAMPNLRLQLTQLYREQKIQETVFLMLTERFESAKISEARDTSSFQILDHAVVPTRKSRPSGTANALVGCVLGLAVMFGRRRLKDYLGTHRA